MYNSDHGPFLYITQYKLATHLVTMDIETFSQLAESLPTQDIKVCVLRKIKFCFNFVNMIF